MNEYYYANGENIDGDFITLYSDDIEAGPLGMKYSFTLYCEKILEKNGGGHLDIFDEEDNYIGDVEV